MEFDKLQNSSTLELVVEQVSKQYPIKSAKEKYVLALKDFSFSFKSGLYGLLGPNGAGKSTLINILTTGMYPTKGRVTLNRKSIYRLGSKYRSILGYMPQQQNLYDGFTGYRFLVYMASLKEIPKEDIKSEINRVIHTTNLATHINKKISAYSGGMKQRLLVASAIIGSPRILIFDEPTAGLDPKERVNFRNYLKQISENNIVIVATHVVSDVESVANEILLIKKGKLVAKDKPQTLIEQFAKGGSLEEVYLSVFSEEENVQIGSF